MDEPKTDGRKDNSGTPGNRGNTRPKTGNRNALQHGVHSFLAIGRMPRGASYVRRLLGKYQRSLRRAVEANGDAVSLYQAGLITSAIRHEGRALLLTRWLRDKESMKDQDKLAYAREIGAATDARDRCVKQLELDRKRDSFADTYEAYLRGGRTIDVPDPEAAPPAADAAAGRTEDDTGHPSQGETT